MKAKYILLFLLGFVQLTRAQIPSETTRKLQSLIGNWDLYMAGGKEIIGEFTAAPFGKSPALQTRFSLPAMQSEVNGVWVYDEEIKSITVFEITSTGSVRSYSGSFKKPEELWFEGYSKQNPDSLTEKSSLTWLSPEKIQVWSKDMKANLEVSLMMIRRK